MKLPNIWLAVTFALFAGSALGALEDITAHGTASQTSEWNGGQFPAANAIDGDPGTFSHSDSNTPNNVWELLLDQERLVAKVELDMRADCCGGRLTGATLRLYDSEGDSVFDTALTDPGIGQTIEVNLPPDTLVRRLRVGFENGATNPGFATTVLHLGEFRAFSEVDLLPVITSFGATSQNVSSGASTQISWQTEGATSVEIIGIGVTNLTGSATVTPANSRVYTLIATNDNGSRTSDLAIIVDDDLLPPRITEFMASNSSTITRSDGSTPDWIELWNPNPETIDLAGYRLTDDPQQPARFIFSATPLSAGEYLVIDAAQISLDGFIATGFSLNRDAGSHLALLDPSGVILQQFEYPKQREDFSYGIDWNGTEKYFLQPTPGAPSITGAIDGFVADTKFSVGRGLYDSPLSVAITTDTESATIYTTLDGSEPSPDNPNATVYLNPMAINTTTVLRAAAYRNGYLPTNIDTQTYIFTDHVGAQSSSPPNFPLSWVPNLNGVQSSVPAFSHFGMDDGVVRSLPLTDSNGQSFDLNDALSAIPTMSLVMDAEVMFDPTDGLHINARSRGRTWERPASIEIIDPATSQQIQANCGIRMHGGWNRYPEMLKKAFRLYFRSEYGDAKLNFPLFPDSPNDQIDGIIMRSGNGKSWASPWRALSGGGNSLPRNTYMRDQFVRDLQAATDNVYIPGRFVHLYINGHYWGLYNPVERPDESFAAARYGGSNDDYDVIKWQRGVGHRVAAGDDVGWNELIGLVRGNTVDPATYAAIRDLLDLPSFVDYMLVNYFVGNGDWIDNNVYAMRNRAEDGAFRFYCWDSEESLLSTGADVTNREVNDTCTEIHHALRSNADYRQLFADRAQKHLFNSGALTQEVTDAIFAARAAEIDRAIVGDSARWGNLLRPSDPYDRADWLNEVSNLRSNYLGQRVGTTLGQLRADDLFPTTQAPTFSPQRGGQVPAGHKATLNSTATGNSTIYYTLDGTDPRLPGGGISPTAVAFDGITNEEPILPTDSAWLYNDGGVDLGDSEIVVGAPTYSSANWKHPNFDDSAWASGVAPLGYGGITGGSITTEIGFGSDTAMKHTTTYFRKSFAVADASRFTALRIRLTRDDGAVVYLNGHEVARSEFPEGNANISANTFAVGVSGFAEGTPLVFEIPASLLTTGENVFAVEVHQASNNSSDLGFSLELAGDVLAAGSGLIAVQDDTLVRARVLAGGEWSAIDEALFITGDRSADLFVSEIMYHPAPGGAEFLEIANRGTNTHSLTDLAIIGGIQFEFTSSTQSSLSPGERLVLVHDAATFASVYPGVPFAGDYSGALGNGGDSFSLENGDGTILWTLTYDDGSQWPAGTDGEGRSLTYVAGEPDSPLSWRPSVAAAGSPGVGDTTKYLEGTNLLDYALAAQIQVTKVGDLIEIQIPTWPGADDAEVRAEWSTDLNGWNDTGFRFVSRAIASDGSLLSTWQFTAPKDSEAVFFRARATLR